MASVSSCVSDLTISLLLCFFRAFLLHWHIPSLRRFARTQIRHGSLRNTARTSGGVMPELSHRGWSKPGWVVIAATMLSSGVCPRRSWTLMTRSRAAFGGRCRRAREGWSVKAGVGYRGDVVRHAFEAKRLQHCRFLFSCQWVVASVPGESL